MADSKQATADAASPRASTNGIPVSVKHRRALSKRLLVGSIAAVLVLGVTALVAWELRTSALQARLLSNYASRLAWTFQEGPAVRTLAAPQGPHDIRNGYWQLGDFQRRLEARGFKVAAQARPSGALLQLSRFGIAPPYDEKPVGALDILDATGARLYRATTDRFHYRRFTDVPPLVVQSLLYVEDRNLLEPQPHLNPAVEWNRFAWAAMDYTRDHIAGTSSRVGGSTLATQIQKFRHSPSGRTSTPAEKLRQMAAASLRAYRDGPDSRATRERILVDYLNSMPMGARRGVGEILGLGEGMWAWFGKTPEDLIIDLSRPEEGADLQRKAETYAQALSLILATQRPARYLSGDMQYLHMRLHLFLEELLAAGVISEKLETAARSVKIEFRPTAPPLVPESFVERRAINAVRTEVMDLLAIEHLYDLDRLDLRLETTLVSTAQQRVQERLRSMSDPVFLQANGMFGRRLLSPDMIDSVVVTFSLYESSLDGNRLLVHADNNNRPFDIHESAKLELGSTAKVRTLANYLRIMERLHARLHELERETLLHESRLGLDPLTRWAATYLVENPDAPLRAFLDASLNRRYSASTRTRFWTGGGAHTFANFDTVQDHWEPTLRMATRHSVNLAFVRLMRDQVDYYIAAAGFDQAALLSDREHPDRVALLEAAAERESRQILWSAFCEYETKTAAELEYERERAQPRLAAHPIEAWVLQDRLAHPHAGWLDVLERSSPVRREVFAWLLRSRSMSAQNSRIRTELERRAFDSMNADWRALGYPFSSLVPSLATCLGSSADRPEALAEFLGIIQNRGLRAPTRRLEALHFAIGTPYETRFEARPGVPRRVLSAEATELLREVLFDVVDQGTGRRVREALHDAQGGRIAIGGKTGSGDNRFEQFDANGSVISSRAINRTATFMFIIGENHYGVVTALVNGPRADRYSFTSSLALQTFKAMAPAIEPLVQPAANMAAVPLPPRVALGVR